MKKKTKQEAREIRPVRVGKILTLADAQPGDRVRFRPSGQEGSVLGTIEVVPRHRRFVVLVYESGGTRIHECIQTPEIGRIAQGCVEKPTSTGWRWDAGKSREKHKQAQQNRRRRERAGA